MELELKEILLLIDSIFSEIEFNKEKKLENIECYDIIFKILRNKNYYQKLQPYIISNSIAENEGFRNTIIGYNSGTYIKCSEDLFLTINNYKNSSTFIIIDWIKYEHKYPLIIIKLDTFFEILLNE